MHSCSLPLSPGSTPGPPWPCCARLAADLVRTGGHVRDGAADREDDCNQPGHDENLLLSTLHRGADQWLAILAGDGPDSSTS